MTDEKSNNGKVDNRTDQELIADALEIYEIFAKSLKEQGNAIQSDDYTISVFLEISFKGLFASHYANKIITKEEARAWWMQINRRMRAFIENIDAEAKKLKQAEVYEAEMTKYL